jgi:zinc protease
MKIKFFLGAALMLFSTTAMAQTTTLPVDPEVRIGKLDNGLTYYIRHNNNPEHVANFYIAQKVGSINEDDNQRGLAHFLEHMAFNGSEHFPDNGIIEYTRSLGVEFGRDLNAYTSLDQTVYNIDNVPTYRQSAVDSCILILKDWSNGLLLMPEEIDKERGVVHGEWRLGSGPGQRMQDAAFPQLFKGSKYGNRLPIGLMSIIDSFRPATLRAYYEKWYRPDNQGIIIVGDIDVDKVEAKIKQLWAGVTVDPNAVKIPTELVPDNNEAIIVVEKDKEQAQNQYQIMMKHDGAPDEMKDQMPYLIMKFGEEMVESMLDTRLQDLAQTPESAFTIGQTSNGLFMYAKTKDAFSTTIIPKEGRDIEAIQQVMRELLRARQYGFTISEYERARADYLANLEKKYTNRAKRKTNAYADDYIENFLHNEPIPSVEDEYQIMSQFVPMLPVDLANEMAVEYITVSDTNLVVLGLLQDKEGVTAPTAENLLAAIKGVRTEKIEPYVDEVSNEPLIATLPQKGKIVKESYFDKFGFKVWELSNGVKVYSKKTDFKDDEVSVKAFANGGLSLYGKNDIQNLRGIALQLGVTGMGGFTNNQLEKMLAGKKADVDFTISTTEQTLGGTSTPKDLETLMQLIYLQFTAATPDQPSHDQMVGMYKQLFLNSNLNPQIVFADSLQATTSCHNPLSKLPDAQMFDGMDYQRMVKIVQERLANARDYTFVFVGNFDEALLKEYVEQYIASLPTKKELAKSKDIRSLWNGHIENRFKQEMQDGQTMIAEMWRTNNIDYTLQNRTLLQVVEDILSNIYLKTIREEYSASYTVQATADVDTDGPGCVFTVGGVCPCDPDKAELAERLLKEGMQQVAQNIDPDMLAKVKEALLKRADTNLRENAYWMNMMYRWNKFGVDCHNGYKEFVQSITPQMVSAFVRDNILNTGHHAEVVMNPIPRAE